MSVKVDDSDKELNVYLLELRIVNKNYDAHTHIHYPHERNLASQMNLNSA